MSSRVCAVVEEWVVVSVANQVGVESVGWRDDVASSWVDHPLVGFVS